MQRKTHVKPHLTCFTTRPLSFSWAQSKSIHVQHVKPQRLRWCRKPATTNALAQRMHPLPPTNQRTSIVLVAAQRSRPIDRTEWIKGHATLSFGQPNYTDPSIWQNRSKATCNWALVCNKSPRARAMSQSIAVTRLLFEGTTPRPRAKSSAKDLTPIPIGIDETELPRSLRGIIQRALWCFQSVALPPPVSNAYQRILLPNLVFWRIFLVVNLERILT